MSHDDERFDEMIVGGGVTIVAGSWPCGPGVAPSRSWCKGSPDVIRWAKSHTPPLMRRATRARRYVTPRHRTR